MSVRIFAMTHKKFDVPPEQLYIPMHVVMPMQNRNMVIWEMIREITYRNRIVIMPSCLVCTGCGRIIQSLIMWESAIIADS